VCVNNILYTKKSFFLKRKRKERKFSGYCFRRV